MVWHLVAFGLSFGAIVGVFGVLAVVADAVEDVVARRDRRRRGPTMSGPWPDDPRVQVLPRRPVLYDQDAET